ncbi:actin patch protein 1 [Aspergillus campestris IBT 28561]|uniref:Actin patch protein 1 n=1 Tax=Aspergillus campestris (strain IBT 28561) TaxID=1392248 RepID=A0A2I1DHF6_ASPC2|nr:actin patch protein 1 [Aspergillus campestris IBT 28561]PKY09299.1 actin patch protein 1 [Aspergillus campestris IBT 28561]
MSQYRAQEPPALGPASGAAPGGRRQKVYGYLKAANELRQTYAAQWTAQRNGQRDWNEEFLRNTPGAFSDVEIARAGDEEMVVFPSYAMRLAKGGNGQAAARRRRDSTSTLDEYHGTEDEPGMGIAELEELEDESVIVAADVRGWVYSPHRGPMTRKHRLMIALARKLSGIPAPNVNTSEGEEADPDAGRTEKTPGRGEEEFVDSEAQSIIKQAEGRADTPWRENHLAEKDESGPPGRPLGRTTATTSAEPPQLSKDELSIANAHLMERLRPFLTNPMAGLPVTVFFFNDEKSQSRSVITDESGHFSLRAGLSFVPTNVRILASEELSAVKAVQVVDPTGISLISDIDDTVKHSAIAHGAKEMFRNTFVRELGDLTVNGVADWYNELWKMGVQMHYVSNAPWQLYPLLDRYFKMVGLPAGSIHLKHYSGMLQGIFEPTAERKKGHLEQILRDFPSRKFILVGDSGEADLEVYTDIALANPKRILGIFIRDITTPIRSRTGFFDKSVKDLDRTSAASQSAPQLVDDSDTAAPSPPTLPPRRDLQRTESTPDARSLDNADLIELRDDEDPRPKTADASKPLAPRAPPNKPSKPSSLRTVSSNLDTGEKDDSSSLSVPEPPPKRKPVPPLPPRPSSSLKPEFSEREPDPSTPPNIQRLGRSTTEINQSRRDPEEATTNPPLANDQRSSRKQPPPPPPPRRTGTGSSTVSTSSTPLPSTTTNRSGPQNPPQQQQQSYPAAAATAALQYASAASQFASERLPWPSSSSSTPSNTLRATSSSTSLRQSSTTPSLDSSYASLPTKREEMWQRRWERAHDILTHHGVVLASWREGKDMKDVSVWLVKEAMKGEGANAPRE